MAEQYPADLYLFRPNAVGTSREAVDLRLPVEYQIQAHVLNGNRAFVERAYDFAARDYLTAWRLLPRLIDPTFPSEAPGIDETVLLRLDLVSPLVAASAQILRYRDTLSPSTTIVATEAPSAELRAVVKQYGERPGIDNLWFRLALAHVQTEEADLARRYVERAIAASQSDSSAQAGARSILAVAAVRAGDGATGEEQFEAAAELYDRAGHATGVAAMRHNLGILATRAGRLQDGAALLTDAATASILGGWEITRSSLPGLVSVSFSAEAPGLSLIVADGTGGWLRLPADRPNPPRQWLQMVRGDETVTIDLARERGTGIAARLLQPRVQANSLAALTCNLVDPSSFVAHLSHVFGFVLPVALGDTYLSLGELDRARICFAGAGDYRYLNQAIERPVVWRKLAQTYLERGRRFFRSGDAGKARAEFAQIASPANLAGDPLRGPLYTGAFAALAAETRAFLAAAEPRSFQAMDFGRRLTILEAIGECRRIDDGMDYLGNPSSTVTLPIQRRHAHFQTARDIARFAGQVERIYRSVRSTIDHNDFSDEGLHRIVRAQDLALRGNERRLLAASEQQRLTADSAKTAAERLANANQTVSELDAPAMQATRLDQISAWRRATRQLPTGDHLDRDRTWIGGRFGRDAGTRNGRVRRMATRAAQLASLQQHVAALTAATAAVAAQVLTADRMHADALAGYRLAELRLDHVRAVAQSLGARETAPEQWANLEHVARDMHRQLLRSAIGAAQWMERAAAIPDYVIPSGIGEDLVGGDLWGLISGDVLLADLKEFAESSAEALARRIPIRATLSLAERFPHQFFRQFRQTGRITFDTLLSDVEHWLPGAYHATVREAGVRVIGLEGSPGLQWKLTNTGLGSFRDRSGGQCHVIQEPATAVFSSSGTVTGELDGAAFANSWILELEAGLDPIDLQQITDVQLVLTGHAFSDAALTFRGGDRSTAAVREQIAGFSLKAHKPRAFAALRDTGSVVFAIDRDLFPLDHQDPRILDLHLLFDRAQRALPVELIASVSNSAAGLVVEQAIDARGVVGTGLGSSPLNAVRGHAVLDTWRVTIDRRANAAAFADGFRWEDIRDVFVLVEYAYTPDP